MTRKILILLLFFINLNVITNLTARCCGGGGDGFFPAFGGSFVGSALSNYMFSGNRGASREVVVVNQPPAPVPVAPAPVMAPEPDMGPYYEPAPVPVRHRSRRSRQENIEQKRIELELLKAENRRLELENRNLELQNKSSRK